MPALVLRLRPFGESNKEAVFLTPEEGIVRAVVYGGAKSKLRAYVSPFQTGTLYLYGAKGQDKVSDFDVRAWRPELRELLERVRAAAFICGAALDGEGGGVMSGAAFALANACLDALQGADSFMSEKIRVHFLWNWLEILGLRPEFTEDPFLDTDAVEYLRMTEGLPPSAIGDYSLGSSSFARLAGFLDGYLREASK